MGRPKGSKNKTAEEISQERGEEAVEVAKAAPGPAQEYPDDLGPSQYVNRDIRPSRDALYEEYEARQAEKGEPEDILGLKEVFAEGNTEEAPEEEPAAAQEVEAQPAQKEEDAPEGFYVATFKDKDAAEKGFKETKAAFTRATQENAWLKKRLQALEAMSQGNYQPAPQEQDLSAEELERLQFENYPEYLKYQEKREAKLVERAKREVLQGFQAAQVQQMEQRLESDMQNRIATNYEALKDDVPLVEAEIIRMSQDLRQKLSRGIPLEPEEAEQWFKVYNDPASITDWAAQRILDRDKRIRQAAEAEGKKTKTRLPANPVEPVGTDRDVAPAAPQRAGPQTEGDYEKERRNFQQKRMAAATI